MQAKRVLSHVDLRVRDRKSAIEYYNGLLGALGMKGSYGDEWCSYNFADAGDEGDWFAFTEDKRATPGSGRVAFAATSREEVDRMVEVVSALGSRAIEGPEFAYGPEYYALFFEDLDGNRLEICYIGK